jgi:tetratricopeptide (TPR) repeat protein
MGNKLKFIVGVAICGILLPPAVRAQSSPREKFEDLAKRAQALLDSRPEEAAVLFKQALELQSSWAEGWLSLGGALYQLNRYAEATDALRKGVELAPGIGTEFEVAVRARAAELLIRSSTFDEALGQLQPLAKHPGLPPVIEELMGLCAMATPDDPAQLSTQRRPVVDLAGKAAWAFASQHPDVAAAAYRQLLQQYANEPGVHYAYGLYLMETDLSAALAEFQKEVQANPKHWPSLLVVASLEIRQGTPDQAILTLREALKVVPAKYRWICHTDLGRANSSLNKADTAIAELENAVRQMPSNANVHFFLAEAYRQAGRKADAEKERAEFEQAKAVQDPLGVPAFHPFGLSGK